MLLQLTNKQLKMPLHIHGQDHVRQTIAITMPTSISNLEIACNPNRQVRADSSVVLPTQLAQVQSQPEQA
jgi:hypothetical protein